MSEDEYIGDGQHAQEYYQERIKRMRWMEI